MDSFTLFSSTPWSPPTSTLPAWHKRSVSYSPTSNLLQTLDIWLPATPPEDLKTLSGYFIILIHGGAWRDPAITSYNFALPSVELLLSSPHASNIAGIISLSHSLSPKPSIPATSPEEAASRNAKHPQHILDILSALHFLHDIFGDVVENKGVLVGHSCGATMALQAVMRSAASWAGNDASNRYSQTWRPAALVLLAGIYNLPLLVSPTTRAFQPYTSIYREFVMGAFGDDEAQAWFHASPAHDVDALRKVSGLIVMADSPDDGMVPPEQGEGIYSVLRQAGWKSDTEGERHLIKMTIKGQHDEMWQSGTELVQVVTEALRVLESKGHREIHKP